MALFLAIQSSNSLAIGRVQPDLMLLMVILFSFALGEFKGQIFGFAMGLLLDAMSGGLFGINAFIFTLLAWFTTLFKKYIQAADVAAFLIYVTLGIIVKYILTAILSWLFKQGNIMDGRYLLQMFLEIIYDLIIGTILYYITPALLQRKSSDF